MIAVALLTCNRPDYTARTLERFEAMNPDRSGFVLVHGDDCSSDDRNLELAAAAGFRTLVRSKQRTGSNALRAELLRYAVKLAPWVLVLENDIEFLKPFPWPMFERVSTDKKLGCLRLYGQYKDVASTQECLRHHKWSGTEVLWQRLKRSPEPAQWGVVHWSPQPSVTLSRLLADIHEGGRPKFRTVRLLENVTSHFGQERTL